MHALTLTVSVSKEFLRNELLLHVILNGKECIVRAA